MWKPFKKKKQIILTPGEIVGLKFLTAWRRDRNEVAIITEKGPIILNETSKFFIEVSAKNADPIKIEVIPDFKKKVLNVVEIVDPNIKRKFTDKNHPQLRFVGIDIGDVPFFEQLKYLDESIEDFGIRIKKYKRSAYLITLTSSLLAIINLYMFITKSDSFRFINLILAIGSIFIPISMWRSYLNFNNHYKQYKESRGKIFEFVDEK